MEKELLYPEKFCEDLCDNVSPVLVKKKKNSCMNPDECFLLWNEKKKIKESKNSIFLIQSQLTCLPQQFRAEQQLAQ